MRKKTTGLLAGLAVVVAAVTAATVQARGGTSTAAAATGASSQTATPIQHLVVIFQENVSFDHYFGTYPTAANTDGSRFTAVPGTPAVDGLPPATDASIPASLQHSTNLLTSNPNSAPPLRLDSTATGLGGGPGGQLTCDQDHNYSDEQQSFDGGLMDQFVQSVGTGSGNSPFGTPCSAKQVMDYYDGNTVTGLWNYAQHFAMSDNSFGTTFGPSAPGAINVTSGDTGGVDTAHEANAPSISTSASPNGDITPDGTGGFSLTSDAQPYWDDCSTRDAVGLTGKNVGDLLNAAGVSWGWFQGGFRPTTTFAAAATATGHDGQPTSTFIPDEFSGSFTGKNVPPHASNQALCDAVHPVGQVLGGTGQWGYKDDYIAHHEPFQYYASTANPHHLTVPTDANGNDTFTGLEQIGTDTQSFSGGYGVGPEFNTPNHNYDTSDFDQLVAAISAGKLPPSALPAVSYLKAPGFEDGHAAYSEPADEQQFVVNEVNALEKSPDWSTTAVIVSYDDSDGWYDHVYSGVTNPSLSVSDNLTNTVKKPATGTSGQCGPKPQTTPPLGGQQGRCGLGPRLPLIVISPWAKTNAVDHNLSDQSSIVNFIEFNWHLPSIPGSFDNALAATDKAEHISFDLQGMFDFGPFGFPFPLPVPVRKLQPTTLILDPATGQIDYRNGVLFAMSLAHQDLEGAEFNGATLRGVSLEGAFLANANFSGATLQGVNTSGAVWSHTICPDGTNSDADGGTCVGHF
jgi:phospholipase C